MSDETLMYVNRGQIRTQLSYQLWRFDQARAALDAAAAQGNATARAAAIETVRLHLADAAAAVKVLASGLGLGDLRSERAGKERP